MYCQNCGAELPSESLYCFKCGEKIPVEYDGETNLVDEIISSGNVVHDYNKYHEDLKIFQSSQRKPIDLSSKIPLIILILVVGLIITLIVNVKINEIKLHREEKEKIETLSNNLYELMESSTVDEEYLKYAKEIIDESEKYEELDEIRTSFYAIYKSESQRYLRDIWHEWESENDLGSISLESVTSELRLAIGFDYNNDDISDAQLLAINFTSLHSTFDDVAENLRNELQPYQDSINIVYESANTYPCDNDIKNEIDDTWQIINESYNKINSVQNRVFITLSDRANNIRLHQQQQRANEIIARLKNNYENRYFKHGYYQFEIEQKMSRDGFMQIASYFAEAPDGSTQVKQEFEKLLEQDGFYFRIWISLQPSYGLGSYYYNVRVTEQ
ncbi:MAG TPA: zinc ribbon domain-containing protein [bacterium]|jgi:hypothetical protein